MCMHICYTNQDEERIHTMKEFIVEKQHSGKRILRYLSLMLGEKNIIPLQIALKNKDIRLNGKRISKDELVKEADEIKLFLPDKYLSKEKEEKNKETLALLPRHLFVYEDANVLFLNKPQGLTVHPGGETKAGTSLIEILRKQLKNEQLQLAHRLDRNTGGLIVLAKNKHIVKKLSFALQGEAMVKRYRCLVRGVPDMGDSVRLTDGDEMKEIRAFWEKPPHKDEVYIHSEKQEKDLPIITRYRVLRVFTSLPGIQEPISELEVELVTGRTHQIRAHFAFLGHALLGDGKYGRNEFNLKLSSKKSGKIKYQQLFATELLFGKQLPPELKALQGKRFSVLPQYDVDGI